MSANNPNQGSSRQRQQRRKEQIAEELGVDPDQIATNDTINDGIEQRLTSDGVSQARESLTNRFVESRDNVRREDVDVSVDGEALRGTAQVREDRRDEVAQRARQSFANDSESFGVEDISVDVGPGGVQRVNLSDSAKRRSAANQFEKETSLTDVDPQKDIILTDDGATLSEDATRREAVERLGEDSSYLRGLDPQKDILLGDDGSVELTESGRRQAAANQFAENGGFGSIDPDRDIELTDDGAKLADSAARRQAANQFAKSSDLLESVDPSEVTITDDKITLNDKGRRRAAAKRFANESESLDSVSPDEIIIGEGDKIRLSDSARKRAAAGQFVSESEYLDSVAPSEVKIGDDDEVSLTEKARRRALEAFREDATGKYVEDQTNQYGIETAEQALFADVISPERFEAFKLAIDDKKGGDPTLFENEQEVDQAIEEGVIDGDDRPGSILAEVQQFDDDQTDRFSYGVAEDALFADIISPEEFEEYKLAIDGKEGGEGVLFESREQVQQAVDEGIVRESAVDDLTSTPSLGEIDPEAVFQIDDGEITLRDDVQRRTVRSRIDRQTDTEISLGDIEQGEDGGYRLGDSARRSEAFQQLKSESEDLIDSLPGEDETVFTPQSNFRAASDRVQDSVREAALQRFDDRLGQLDFDADDIRITEKGAAVEAPSNARFGRTYLGSRSLSDSEARQEAADIIDNSLPGYDIGSDDIIKIDGGSDGEDVFALNVEGVFGENATATFDADPSADNAIGQAIRASAASQLDSRLISVDITPDDVVARDDGTVGLSDQVQGQFRLTEDDIALDDRGAELGLSGRNAVARGQLEEIANALPDEDDVFFPGAGNSTATEVALAVRDQLESGLIEDRQEIAAAFSGGPDGFIPDGTVDYIEGLDPEKAGELIDGVSADDVISAQSEIEAQRNKDPSEIIKGISSEDSFGDEASLVKQGDLINRQKRSQARQLAEDIEEQIGQTEGFEGVKFDVDVNPETGERTISEGRDALIDRELQNVNSEIDGSIGRGAIDIGFEDGQFLSEIDQEAVVDAQIDQFRSDTADRFGVDESVINVGRGEEGLVAELDRQFQQQSQDIDLGVDTETTQGIDFGFSQARDLASRARRDIDLGVDTQTTQGIDLGFSAARDLASQVQVRDESVPGIGDIPEADDLGVGRFGSVTRDVGVGDSFNVVGDSERRGIELSNVGNALNWIEDRTGVDIIDGNPRVQRQNGEQLGDFDWSFGFGDPDEDEVEQAFDGFSEFISEGSETVGQKVFDGGVSPVTKGLELAGRDDLADKYDSAIREVGVGTITGIGNLVGQVPQLATEVPETAGFALTQTDEFVDRAPDVAARQIQLGAESALDNPARFSGELIGSAALSGYAFRATQGTRLGGVTRASLQPGEELIKGGISRGLLGKRAARYTPGVRMSQIKDRSFLADDRGQMQFSIGTETETDTKASSDNQTETIEVNEDFGVDPIDIGEQRTLSRTNPRLSASEAGRQKIIDEQIEAGKKQIAPEDRVEPSIRQDDIYTVSREPDLGPNSPVAEKAIGRGLDTDLNPGESLLAAQLDTPTGDLRGFDRVSQAPTRDLRDAVDQPASRGLGDTIAGGVGAVFGVGPEQSERDEDPITGSPTLTGEQTPTTSRTLFEGERSVENGRRVGQELETSPGSFTDTEVTTGQFQPGRVFQPTRQRLEDRQRTDAGFEIETGRRSGLGVEPGLETGIGTETETEVRTGLETGLGFETSSETETQTGFESAFETDIEQTPDIGFETGGGFETGLEREFETGFEPGTETPIETETSSEQEEEESEEFALFDENASDGVFSSGIASAEDLFGE